MTLQVDTRVLVYVPKYHTCTVGRITGHHLLLNYTYMYQIRSEENQRLSDCHQSWVHPLPRNVTTDQVKALISILRGT